MTKTEYVDTYDNYFYQRNLFAHMDQLLFVSMIFELTIFGCSIFLYSMEMLTSKQSTVILNYLAFFITANALLGVFFYNKSLSKHHAKLEMILRLEKFFKEEKTLEEFWTEVEVENQGYFFPKK